MVKCVFCGKEEPEFIGIHYIKNDGSVNYFCSSKCRKNVLHLKRDKRKVRWSEAYRIERQKTALKASEIKEKASKK